MKNQGLNWLYLHAVHVAYNLPGGLASRFFNVIRKRNGYKRTLFVDTNPFETQSSSSSSSSSRRVKSERRKRMKIKGLASAIKSNGLENHKPAFVMNPPAPRTGGGGGE